MSVLDATTGQFRWKTQLIEPLSLAIGDGRLYVGMMNVSAYDLTSGRLVWKMAREMPSHTIINVYYASMKLFVVAEEQVYILDASDGQVLESFESAGTAYQTVTDGEIFGVDRSQFASATDIESGRLQWKKYIHPFGLVPTLIRGALYVITDDLELLALDPKTGEQKWKSDTIQRAFSSVVELNGLGYVLSDTGRLYAFDLTTGQAVGVLDTGNGLPFDFGNDFRPSLIVAGKTLVFSFEDSPIYGFQAKSP